VPDEARRFSDALLAEMKQKLEDHIRFDESEHAVFVERMNRIESDMSPIKHIYERISWPAQAIGWFIITVLTGGLLWAGTKWGEILSRHWK